MKKQTKVILPVLLAASLLITSIPLQANLFDTFIHNLAAGLGNRIGKNSAHYLWNNHRKKLIIVTGIAIAVWYWKKKEDEKERNKHGQCHHVDPRNCAWSC